MGRRPVRRHARPRALRRVALGSTLAITFVGVGGTASAFWTAYGQGAGSAPTDALAVVSLSPGAPAAQLYPGGLSDVVLTITNPNTATVRIGSLALDGDRGTGGFSVDADHTACGLSALAFTAATNGLVGWTVPGAADGTAGTVTTTLPGALSMSLDAADECQGAVVTVYLSAGP
jgi:hypothetical protein